MTDKLIAQAKEMGLEGSDILQYVERQQTIERDERARERDAQRKHELELEALKLKQAEIQYKAGQKQAAEEVKAKTPRLPSFTEGKGIDGYLLRFERFARANHWAEGTWASSLSALLTGKALDVYSRLSDAEAQDYDKVKEAILKRYELTEDGFRKKFRSEIPQEGEGPDQYIVRLSSYLNRWIELSGTSKTFEGICDLIIQEQFLDLCPMDLAIHLRERKPKSLEENHVSKPTMHQPTKGYDKSPAKFQGKCFQCDATGHRKADCPRTQTKAPKKSMFAQGRYQFWDGALGEEESKHSSKGTVNGQRVQMYRDTGSSMTYVNQRFVPKEAYQKNTVRVRLANGTVDTIPTARVKLEVGGSEKLMEVGVMDTPYPGTAW
ncbi:PREDICTED: uncharacterized protein LOC109477509 [Branchiostoma belcheri]|uniref:Uncharacterized protein LOC109477509 n=1 Tax=Branchiostoma belcheri TaxID=7741 RepID=A0A6P4ZXM4_BRABE|nr:PREDICTED: uncharacterized protein LOC109477509 [Branchiostoma belcheri]